MDGDGYITREEFDQATQLTQKSAADPVSEDQLGQVLIAKEEMTHEGLREKVKLLVGVLCFLLLHRDPGLDGTERIR